METLIRTLKDAVLSRAKDEFYLVWGFKGELKNLEEHIGLVTAFLSDAERKSSSDASVQLWLKNLRDQVYEAVAVFDEFRYEQLRREIEVEGRCWNEVTDFFSPSNHLICRLMLAHRIKKINSELDHINNRAKEYKLHSQKDAPSESLCSANSGVWGGDIQNVVGRENDVSRIVGMLVSPSNEEERLSVIVIVGMAGCGKTALARLVCEDKRVVRYFDESCIMWVSVSDNFKVERILSDMLEVLTKKTPGSSNQTLLRDSLREVLKDKKYLLILDDVWCEDPLQWDGLKEALLAIGGGTRSKVIVTTRSTQVDSKLKLLLPSLTFDLQRLTPVDSWTLFSQRVFAKGEEEKSPELVKIGKEIVSRCDGVPLVLCVLGSILYSKKSEREWVSIRDHESWGSIEDIGDRVNKIMKLSFDHLSPSPLKHCFSYSSIFPKDSIIDKDSIVQMWLALELLPCEKNLELEDVGNNYFQELLGKSLLQEPDIDKWGDVESCKMHDLVHDLAERTSEGYCCSQMPRVIPDTVAHLSLLSPTREMLDQAYGCFGRLQTLFLEGPLMVDMFDKLTLLRVLVLVDNGTTELPKSVEKLKHLRYLDVSRTGIKEFSGSITRLYNLQTLRIGDMAHVPERLGNLVSLRHFYGGVLLVGVGKLTELQSLGNFKVQPGCLIGELGGLNKLKGKLEIQGLKDVENLEEAKSAKLSEKSNIKTLTLDFYWDHGGRCALRDVEDVLEGLRPHSNLTSLVIIQLSYCGRCEQLPTLGHLPNLKKVNLFEMYSIRRIGAEFYGNGELGGGGGGLSVFFPVLTELTLSNMSNLEEWMDVKEFPSLFTKKQQPPYLFPNLEKFWIDHCDGLIALPISMFEDCRDIREIRIDCCPSIKVIPDIKGLQTLTSLSLSVFGEWITELPSGIETLTSLNTLSMCYMPRVASVPDLGGLTRLQELKIGGLSWVLDEFPWPYNCSSSTSDIAASSPPSSSTSSVSTSSSSSSLRVLHLCGWEELHHLPQQLEHLSASLIELKLEDFHELESLPEWLGNLSSLQSLEISFCKNLKSMPSKEAMHRLTKLQKLEICGCYILSKRCVKGSGTEWHKIQHIPYIYTDN